MRVSHSLPSPMAPKRGAKKKEEWNRWGMEDKEEVETQPTQPTSQRTHLGKKDVVVLFGLTPGRQKTRRPKMVLALNAIGKVETKRNGAYC